MKTFTRTAIGVGVVGVLFIAMLLIPATYTKTVGSQVTIELPGTGHSMNEISSLFDAMESVEGLANINARQMNDKTVLDLTFDGVKPNTAQKKIETLMAANWNSARTPTISTEPVKVEIGGNALAAITGGRIVIHTAGMTDAEIEAAMRDALMGQGMDEVDVSVQTSPDGQQREVRVEARKELQDGEEPGTELEIVLDPDETGNMPQGQRREVRIVRDVEEE